MTQAIKNTATWLVLVLLGPRLLPAQVVAFFDPKLSLGAEVDSTGKTTVYSSVGAVLYNNQAVRLISQVIIGHAVRDITTRTAIYEKRVVSETGEASDQKTLSGVAFHCYETDLAAHANAYNLHQAWVWGPQCADPYVPEPPPKPDPPDETCPVLLDLEQDGFHLSGPDPAVRFDIDADGFPDQIAWTKAGEDDAFLCLDRNGNGVIDDGRELFGYAAPLLSGGPAQVGYRALAELDRPERGGNQDGKIDATDEGFSDLCAWIDTNRDGVSQPDEIQALGQVGVLSLDYDYKTVGIRDSFGNRFRYVSRAMMRNPSGAVRPWRTFDVIFAEP